MAAAALMTAAFTLGGCAMVPNAKPAVTAEIPGEIIIVFGLANGVADHAEFDIKPIVLKRPNTSTRKALEKIILRLIIPFNANELFRVTTYIIYQIFFVHKK